MWSINFSENRQSILPSLVIFITSTILIASVAQVGNCFKDGGRDHEGNRKLTEYYDGSYSSEEIEDNPASTVYSDALTDKTYRDKLLQGALNSLPTDFEEGRSDVEEKNPVNGGPSEREKAYSEWRLSRRRAGSSKKKSLSDRKSLDDDDDDDSEDSESEKSLGQTRNLFSMLAGPIGTFALQQVAKGNLFQDLMPNRGANSPTQFISEIFNGFLKARSVAKKDTSKQLGSELEEDDANSRSSLPAITGRRHATNEDSFNLVTKANLVTSNLLGEGLQENVSIGNSSDPIEIIENKEAKKRLEEIEKYSEVTNAKLDNIIENMTKN